MGLQNMIDFSDLSLSDFSDMMGIAEDIRNHPEMYAHACDGKILATLFYEPSTRTQLSFQTAMLRLGGSVIGFSDPNVSSVKKGESLRDTVRIIGGYADITAIRHPQEGAAYAASLYAGIPVINAGDGGHLHPTQTMIDLYTMTRDMGRCDHLTVGFCGDLLYGRTVHSLISALLRYEGNTLYLISTPELALPDYVMEQIRKAGVECHVVSRLEDCIGELDVLYMTRIQKERFSSLEEYEKQSGIYVLTSEKMKKAKEHMIVLHPLPKVDEITYEVDDDPRARYFEQARNGLYIRMALIYTLCRTAETFERPPVYPAPVPHFCRNPRCISGFERYLPPRVKTTEDGTKVCAYCDQTLSL